jgi:hypothetical protein
METVDAVCMTTRMWFGPGLVPSLQVFGSTDVLFDPFDRLTGPRIAGKWRRGGRLDVMPSGSEARHGDVSIRLANALPDVTGANDCSSAGVDD